jgi:hypothetical protein
MMNNTITNKTMKVVLPININERREYKKTNEYKALLKKYAIERRNSKYNDFLLKKAKDKAAADKKAFLEVKKGYQGKVKDYFGDGRYYVFDDGRVYSYTMRRFKTQCKTVQGYHYIGMPNGDRKLIHRMVAEMFIKRPKNNPEANEVNHEDLDKSNNNYSNLSWVTRRENIRHALANGCNIAGILDRKRGEKCWNAKLKPEQVVEIRELYAKGFKAVDLGKMYHISSAHIYRIVNRNTWKHI